MRPKRGTVLAYVLVALITHIAAPLSARSATETSGVVLANDVVRFEFQTGCMGLSGMTDLAAGINHIQPVDGKYALWQLTLGCGAEKRSISSTQVPCTSTVVETLSGGDRRATFNWSAIDLEKEKAVITVRVTVDLPRDSGIAKWRIWVDNNSNAWGLYSVDFPKCAGFLRVREYDIAVPTGNAGKLFKNCGEKMSYRYPHGWSMPMQFVCAMKGSSAVYVAAHDPNAWDKTFVIDPGKEFYLGTNAENMGVPGSDHKDPFAVMMGIYHGSWLEGCKIYRAFAITAPWTSQGRISRRTSMPQALKDVGLWMLVGGYIGPEDGTTEQKNKPLIDAQEYFDVPIAAHWYNWHAIPFDTHYPHYFPTKPGVPAQMRELVSRGLVIMPYINGRIVDISNEDFNDYFPYCAKDQGGKHYVETYGNGVKQAPMCSYTEFWQDKIAGIVERVGAEAGANAVYIDQIAAAGPALCFDKSHGHPLGGGGWWVDGYRKMLGKVQKVAHGNGRNMIVTTECAAEPFMDGVDAFLTWIKPDDREIPMMTAVYSGYSIYFSSPAWFEHGDRGWIMAQGRAFLWGIQNGWMGFELFRTEHANKAAYLKKVGRYRVTGKKFLTFGELVDVVKPTNRIETITERWPDHGNNPRDATLPSMQGTVWKAEDDSLGIFLVNYLDKDNAVEFTVDPASYGIVPGPAGFSIKRVGSEGSDLIREGSAGPISLIETLGSRDIRILEISTGRSM